MIISAKYRRKMRSGLEPSFMCDASLSFFSMGPPVYVCYTYAALRARGACPLQGYWLLILYTWPTLTGIIFMRGTGWNWTPGLMTTCCLAVRLRAWHPWHTFRSSLNWTDVARYSCLFTITFSNQFRYFAGQQQSWPLAWSTHCATIHTDYWMGAGKNNKFSMQCWM